MPKKFTDAEISKLFALELPSGQKEFDVVRDSLIMVAQHIGAVVPEGRNRDAAIRSLEVAAYESAKGILNR